jgi:hypothetical protein
MQSTGQAEIACFTSGVTRWSNARARPLSKFKKESGETPAHCPHPIHDSSSIKTGDQGNMCEKEKRRK